MTNFSLSSAVENLVPISICYTSPDHKRRWQISVHQTPRPAVIRTGDMPTEMEVADVLSRWMLMPAWMIPVVMSLAAIAERGDQPAETPIGLIYQLADARDLLQIDSETYTLTHMSPTGDLDHEAAALVERYRSACSALERAMNMLATHRLVPVGGDE